MVGGQMWLILHCVIGGCSECGLGEDSFTYKLFPRHPPPLQRRQLLVRTFHFYVILFLIRPSPKVTQFKANSFELVLCEAVLVRFPVRKTLSDSVWARPLGCGWGGRPPDMEVSCKYIE